MSVLSKTLQARINIAKKQDKQRAETWSHLDKVLRNDFGSITLPNGDLAPRIGPNILHSHLMRTVPIIYSSDANFTVIPEAPDLKEIAAVNNHVLNHYWRKLEVGREVRLAICNALTYRTGWIKVGMPISYQREELLDPKRDLEKAQNENLELLFNDKMPVRGDDDHDDEHIVVHQAFKEEQVFQMMAQQSPELVEKLDAHMNEHYEAPEREMEGLDLESLPYQDPFLKSVPPHHIFLEPGIDRYEQTNYILHRRAARIEDLKISNLYRADVVEKMKATHVDGELKDLLGKDDRVFDVEEALSEYPSYGLVWIYEMWDKSSKTLVTGADGIEDLLTDEEGWPYSELKGYPFFPLTYSDVPQVVAGPSSLESLLFSQELLQRLYAQIGDHTGKAGSLVIVDEGLLTEESKRDIQETIYDPTHRRVVMAKGNVREVVHIVNGNDLDGAIPMLIQMIENGTVPENSGASPEQSGRSASSTATQASILASAGNILNKDKINTTQAYQIRLAQALLGILKQHGPEDGVIPLDQKETITWQAWSKADLNPNANLIIDSPAADDSERERAMALNLKHEYAADPNIPVEGKLKIDRWVLKTHGIKNPDDIMDVSADVRGHIEKENLLLEMGYEVQPVAGEDHSQHLMGHSQYQQLPAVAKHIQMHQQFMQQGGGGQGRRRNASAYPTGNTGRTYSVTSAQISGG